jgi:hypothetical protein
VKKNSGNICVYLLLIACVGFSACVTRSDAYKDIDDAVQKNEFELGVEAIRRGQRKSIPLYPEKNAISLFLDKGLLEHYAGNYAESSEDLQEAERLIEEAFTKSVTADVASYIANDNTREYPGEDFEDIYLNIFNALNYYRDGKIDGALVEIRKLTWSSGKLDMLSRKYENADKNAAGDTLLQLSKLGFTSFPDLPQRKSAKFSDSALVRYLSTLFYLDEGKTDNARIEFERMRNAFAASPNVYSGSFPPSATAAQNVPDGKARLNIISFTGLSPIKEEEIFNQFFPFFQNMVLCYPQFKLPVLVKRPSQIDRIEVIVEGGRTFNLELLEDMGTVIEETYNARFSSVFFKTYIRTLLKYASVDIAVTAARTYADSPLVELAAIASALAVKTAFDATESADIRMTRYLPDKAHIGGINLEPGSYHITVHYYSGDHIVTKEEHKDVAVRANRLNLIETVNLR